MKTRAILPLLLLAALPVFGVGFGQSVSIDGYRIASLPVTATFAPVGPLTCNQGAAGPTWPVSASQSGAWAVSVSNFPATQPVSGTVTANIGTSGALCLDATQTSGAQKTQIVNGANTAAISAAGAVKVDGSAVTQPVSGTVAVSNFPATQPVSGTVAVSNFPATQPVSGTVTANQSGAWAVSVSNFPATQPVSGTVTANIGTSGALALDATLTAGTQKTQIVNGANTLSVSAAGAAKVDGSAVTQPVSGTVAVSNFPATQPVSGTVTANQGGTWTVQPGNTANTTAWKVDGSAVTQPVSGTVSANATQTGTWTVQPGNTANTTAWLVTGNATGNFPGSGTGRSTNPAAVGDGVNVTNYSDRMGRRVTMLESPRELKASGNISLSTTTETTLIAAGAAGVFHDLTLLVITTDDTVLATNTVTIRDATAGTAIMTFDINSSANPVVIPFTTSISQTTAANNWTAQLGSATTAGRNIKIFATAAKH